MCYKNKDSHVFFQAVVKLSQITANSGFKVLIKLRLIMINDAKLKFWFPYQKTNHQYDKILLTIRNRKLYTCRLVQKWTKSG